MGTRVTVDDLELAATWLEAYESSDEDAIADEAQATMFRVAAWLRSEARHRQEDAIARRLVAKRGVTTAQARAAIRRVNA